jgi:hypothetical protein
MDIPRELVEQFSRGDGAVFVGAGLSVGAGLPGWAGLVRPLAQAVGARWPADEADLTVNHLLTTVQYYENQRGRNALVRHLRDELETTGVQPTPVHRLLASLPTRVIFTTNYDDLVERALREARRPLNVVVSEPELSFWSEERVQVVKLCGDLDRPESIVVTQRDFSTYFATHPRLAERLRSTLESKASLFLGYSLRDPFFNQIWDHVGLDFGALRKWGYAVLFDASRLESDDLRQRGIHAIDLETRGRDRTALLAEWLEVLSNPPARAQDAGESTPGPPHGTGHRWPAAAQTPPLPPRRPERTTAPPASRSRSPTPVTRSDVSYGRGLDILRAQLEQTNRYADFNVLEMRLRENLRDERLYGPSEQTRRDRAHVIDGLNRLALDVLGASFNDLSLGRAVPGTQVSAGSLSLVRELNVALTPGDVQPPVHPRLQRLPFNELSWEQFEALCAALVEANPLTVDCHLYGVRGDDQQGIDVVATQRGADGGEIWAYQCKRYKAYAPGKLKEALDRMTYQADYYVLLLSTPATAALRRVADETPGVFLWDANDISRKLKNYPAIVEDFFGAAWRDAFCGWRGPTG